VFAEWRWDGQRLAVHNGPLGFAPLYYHVGDDEIWLSTSIARLLEEGVPRALDSDALSVFLRYGNLIGEETLFAGIRVVPAGARFKWSLGRLECEGTYDPPAPRDLERGEQIDGLVSLFRQAIARRAPDGEQFVVPLSGGKDSRFTLFELNRQGHTPSRCLTARHPPPRTDQDLETAREICARLALRHVQVDLPADPAAVEVAKNLRTDFCSDEHGWLLAVADAIGPETAIVYDGIGGDVLSDISGDGMCSHDLSLMMESGDCERAARRLVRLQDSTIRRLVHPDLFRKLDAEKAHDRVARELRRHVDAPNPVASYFFWNRTRRKIALAPFRLFGHVPTVYAPFLDSDVVEFLSSLTWRSVADARLRGDAIATAYPHLADLPFAVEPAWIHSSRRSKQYYARFASGIVRYSRRRRLDSLELAHPLYVGATLAAGRAAGAVAGRFGWLYTRILLLRQLGRVLGSGFNASDADSP